MIEIVFYGINWWGYPIYKTSLGTPIVKLDEGYYSLSDHNDIDSEPCSKLNDSKLKIVDKFTS